MSSRPVVRDAATSLGRLLGGLALGISWVVLVPAEMLVVILAIGLLGIALDALAQWLLRDRVVRT